MDMFLVANIGISNTFKKLSLISILFCVVKLVTFTESVCCQGNLVLCKKCGDVIVIILLPSSSNYKLSTDYPMSMTKSWFNMQTEEIEFYNFKFLDI